MEGQFKVKWTAERLETVRLFMRSLGLRDNDNTLFATAAILAFRTLSRREQLASIAKAAELLRIASPTLSPEDEERLKNLDRDLWEKVADGLTSASELSKSPKKRRPA